MDTLYKVLIGIMLGLAIAMILLRLGVDHGKRVGVQHDKRGSTYFAGCKYVLVVRSERKLPFCVGV